LESLFVFGTKPDNLREVVETLKQEKQDEISIGDLFEINPDVKDKPLIIPVYKLSDSIIAEERDVIKFQINPDDYDLVKNYFNYIGDKIAVVKFDCNISVLNKVKQVFEDKEEKKNLFLYDEDISQIYKPELLLRNIFNHFNNRAEELDKFKNLEEEIIHFKRITVSVKELNSIREKINKVKRVRDKDNIKKNLMEKLERKEITIDEYTSAIEKITRESSEKEVYKELTIELLQNHYYIPVILSKPEKVDYIKHIIKTESEVNFLKDLEEYLKKEDNFFKKFDWWYFSKIDETLDSVYIPYYQPKTNRIEKFKPDFIFWLKKGNQYIILFVDPKGTEHTDAYRKIDGYSRIFEIEKNGQRRSKVFSYGEYNIETKLLLKTKDKAKVLNEYEKYWFDNLDDLMKKI
ncbi:MAG: restriction endonuclease subunit R, partial [Hydrogenothermaceae bacterium]